MNTLTNSLLAAVVLAGAGVAYQLYLGTFDTQRSGTAVSPVAVDSEAKVAEAPAKIVTLRRDEQQQKSVEPVAVVKNRPDQAPDTKPEAENQNRLELAFAQESYDTFWSADAELSLAEKIQTDIGAGSQLHGVVCHETVCRLQLRHQDLKRELQFLATFAKTGQFTNDGKQGSYASSLGPDGTVVAEFYYGKTSS